MGREEAALLTVVVVKNFSVDIAHLGGHRSQGFDHQPRLFVIELSDRLAFFWREHNLVAIVTADRFRPGGFGLYVQFLPVERGVKGALAKCVGPFGSLLDTGALESRVLPSDLAITAGCDLADAGEFGDAKVLVGRGLVDG